MGKTSVRWLIGVVVVAAFGTMLWLATRPPPLTIQGEVSADRVDISPRVAARIIALKANVGDTVEKGAGLAELESPQLFAARLDEVTRNLQLATRKRESAEAAFQLASQGASKEERALAAAQVKQAEATLNQRDVDVAEFAVRSPINGQVTTRVAALGENFSAGAPLFSMFDMDNLWFTFNLREDLLGGLKIGDKFDVTVPALKSQIIPVRVTMINVQGQYAAWRATRATGDFDLRTFEVRALPIQPVDGLRPGMSAIVSWANRGR